MRCFSWKSTIALLPLFILLAGLPMALQAQIATGGLTGTVSDSSGAKIVGATITLTNNGTGVSATTTSSAGGTYFFNAVLPGTYSLKATQKGFKTFNADGIEIHVQQTDNLDIQLPVGAVSENVTVTTEAALIQTEDATLGQTIDTQSMDECR